MRVAIWDFSATYLNPLKRCRLVQLAGKNFIKVFDLKPDTDCQYVVLQELAKEHIMSNVQSNILAC